MRLEFVKAFVQITKEIFSEVLDSNVATGPLSLANTPKVEGKVITLVDLGGDVLGKIILQMDLNTAIKMSEKMMGKPTFPKTMVASCIAELTGMAVGRAISWINDQDWNIGITPPIVIMETPLQVVTQQVETLVFPLNTSCGEVILNITVVDKL